MDMDIDMAIMDDGSRGASYACSECGKHVCHSCAVSNLGEGRRCLDCAGRGVGRADKRGGGLGWC